jgi:hypothetical protein
LQVVAPDDPQRRRRDELVSHHDLDGDARRRRGPRPWNRGDRRGGVAPAIAWWPIAVLAASGCNALLGLEPTRLGDAGEAGDDAALPDAAASDTGVLSAFSADDAHRAAARFGPPAEVCDALVAGDGCTASVCVPDAPPGRPHAGLITVAGDGALVLLSPGEDGEYPMVTGAGPLYGEGQLVTFSAPGAEVPAFIESVRAPAVIVLGEAWLPALHEDSEPLIPRTGFELTWPAGQDGSWLTLSLVADGGDGRGSWRLACRFPAGTGRAAVPGALLDEAPAGPAVLDLEVKAEVEQTIGDHRVVFRAGVPALRVDRARVGGTVRIP